MVWPSRCNSVEQAHHQGFVHLIEIAGGLVGKDHVGLIDQRPRHAHALLLASGKLRRQMPQPVAQSHAAQRLRGFALIREAVEILRQHHVFKRRQIRNQVELLKDEADFLRAKAGQRVAGKRGDFLPVERHAPGGRCIEATEDIQQRAFAGAGRAHHGDPLAFFHCEGNVVERIERRTVGLGQTLNFNERQFSSRFVVREFDVEMALRRHMAR